MVNTYFKTLIALAGCTLAPACSQIQYFGDDNIIMVDGEPHVKESKAEQAANMKESQDLLQEIQKAARQCTSIAWEITYFNKRDKEVTHIYPFTPEETEKAREIFLTRAHPVMWDDTMHPSPPVLFCSICFLDASGKELTSVSSMTLGSDSSTTSNGYQYCSRISMPDADREFLSNAGNKEKREKDAARFYKKAK